MGAGSFPVAEQLGFGALTAVAQFQSPVRELTSCKLHSTAKKEREEKWYLILKNFILIH